MLLSRHLRAGTEELQDGLKSGQPVSQPKYEQGHSNQSYCASHLARSLPVETRFPRLPVCYNILKHDKTLGVYDRNETTSCKI
jgi:hypothetical protein